jgi:hypothetical protein
MRSLAFIFVVSTVTLASCGDSSLTRTLPNVTGSTGEVLVVMDRALWDGSPGKAIRDNVAPVLVGLPQAEPAFTLVHANPYGFKDVLVAHRNIIFVAIERGKPEPSVTFERNKWSETQLVITISAPDSLSLAKTITDNGEAIRQRINAVERERITDWLVRSAGRNKSILTSGDQSYEIIMPAGYRTDYNKDNVLIVSEETPATTQSVIISVSDRVTSRIGCIELADMTEKVTSAKIKGPEGSFMVIEKQVPVSCRSFRFNNTDYIEMRGLWTLEGGYMGGPFISYAFIDPVTAKAVLVTGFVYAPRDDKRELLRQVEALMYTVRKSS